MGIALIKAIWRDGRREKHGLATTHVDGSPSEGVPAE
jgi:hypothetical protein